MGTLDRYVNRRGEGKAYSTINRAGNRIADLRFGGRRVPPAQISSALPVRPNGSGRFDPAQLHQCRRFRLLGTRSRAGEQLAKQARLLAWSVAALSLPQREAPPLWETPRAATKAVRSRSAPPS